jgi:hypothetical protein
VADIIVSVDEPIDATQCGGKENCLGEGGRCMTHDLWASLNVRMVEFLDSVTCRSWSTSSWPRACRSRDKPHVKRAISSHAGGQAGPHQRPQLGVCPGQRLRQILSRATGATLSHGHDPRISRSTWTTAPPIPCDERVVDAMVPWLRQHFGNPASRSHAWGWEAEAAVEKARGHVAELIGADPREIVWTSGATESNNLALKGAAGFYKTRASTSSRSRPSTRRCWTPAVSWSARVSRSPTSTCREDGLLDLEVFKAAIRPDTILASVMFVNNEIGVIQDIAAIGAICRAKGVIFHVDAAQATGRVDIDLASCRST